MPEEFEKKGTGINTLTYWATSDLLGDWTELPDILPTHLNISRRLKRLFTGNLEEKIYTNPHFIGREKHLLRAQIARISHSTTILPKGYYEIGEDEPQEVSPTAEFTIPNTVELASTDMWVHLP